MNVAALLLPDFSLILAGWLICRFTPLNRSVWHPLERLVYYLLFPILLFLSIVKSPIEVGPASSLIAAGLLLSCGGIALSWSLPHLPLLARHIAPREHAGAAQVAFRFNSYIALALASRLAGEAGSQAVAILIGVCVPLINVAAVWPMARQSESRVLHELARNPLIIATVSGLAFNLAGLALPGWLTPQLQRVGATAVPLGLMAVGAGMHWGQLQNSRVLTAGVLAIRHVLMPLWAWVLARLLGLGTVQASVLIAFAALPTASSCYVLAVQMGYRGPYVAGLITLSHIVALASLPLALRFLS
ncbi:AEC family transporter [Comamonas sp. NLF-1-9]|uniref:AEC family transporter n=1 Tax=Comamonas sp. NLF-1-9 TaxID=2853163 RepID=UPI001C43C628|nr:AEC family transporter [Comamonas sp. NLF-1-9]QXL85673.1 AEC family transporter [Comamonas sp. NLF-1-9]